MEGRSHANSNSGDVAWSDDTWSPGMDRRWVGGAAPAEGAAIRSFARRRTGACARRTAATTTGALCHARGGSVRQHGALLLDTTSPFWPLEGARGAPEEGN